MFFKKLQQTRSTKYFHTKVKANLCESCCTFSPRRITAPSPSWRQQKRKSFNIRAGKTTDFGTLVHLCVFIYIYLHIIYIYIYIYYIISYYISLYVSYIYIYVLHYIILYLICILYIYIYVYMHIIHTYISLHVCYEESIPCWASQSIDP